MSAIDQLEGQMDLFEPAIIADGFGSEWEQCGLSECDLEVVRPGKAQCSGYCDELDVDEEYPR